MNLKRQERLPLNNYLKCTPLPENNELIPIKFKKTLAKAKSANTFHRHKEEHDEFSKKGVLEPNYLSIFDQNKTRNVFRDEDGIPMTKIRLKHQTLVKQRYIK